MRILFIAPRFHTNQKHLIHELISNGNVVDFFVIGKGISESYDELNPKEIPLSKLNGIVNSINNDFSDYAIKAIPKIFPFLRMINDFKPDVIILRGASSPLYSKIVIGFSILKRIKIVFYTQGPKYVKSVSMARKIHDWFFVNILGYRWFTPVLHKGPHSNSNIELSYIDFIPFFMPPHRENVMKKETDLNHVNFLCVGKFEPRKNLSLLLEVVRDLNRKYSNFELTIIGSTGTPEREKYYKVLQNFVDSNCLENVRIIPNVPYDLMRYHYENTDVMILPSVKEPASVSQIEAMSFGCAVVCSEDNGTAHYVENYRNGIVCIADFHNLRKSLKFYLDSPHKIIEHGHHSLEIIRQKFSMEKSYHNLFKILEN